jgi:hypothetical protein
MVRPRTRRRHGRRILRFKHKWSPEITGRRFLDYRRKRTAAWGLGYNMVEALVRATDDTIVWRATSYLAMRTHLFVLRPEEWPWYEALVQRVGAKARCYGGKTLVNAIDVIVSEFIARGLDPAVSWEIAGIGAMAERVYYTGAVMDVAKKDDARLGVVGPYSFYADACSADYAWVSYPE